ncbi:MAG: Asp-tRNA(Asn)/Glu-tRNA(Gln) amidotransferase GatCAB subunit B, partial [Planctomycetes bacterium]|nr:Asp-tRNA(Asn)/Glu-tRNA(Gln) amidotransferase GatCAB subunit B [Planctomycetota bacterium]
MEYEIVIGLEVHVQLLTQTKMFCGCRNKFTHEPNTNVCPVCLGQPGSLPVTNMHAFELGMKGGLAINCEIPPLTKFDRKHYYYPDLPKNIQISQYDMPVCVNGWLDVNVDGETRRIGITRAHLEEDAGKLIHGEGSSSVDLNRTGT